MKKLKFIELWFNYHCGWFFTNGIKTKKRCELYKKQFDEIKNGHTRTN